MAPAPALALPWAAMRRRLALLLLPLVACSTAADNSALTEAGATDVSGDMSQSTGTEGPAPTAGTTTPTTGDEPPVTTGTTTDQPPATSGPPAGPCGQPPPFTGVMAQTIEAAGLERDYDLAIPADYDPDHAYPLVFAWHGRGGNGELARLYFKVEEAAAGQAIFVYPDALPLPEMDGQTGWDL
jgi:polyhydroxybutyrate depolymerase